jgi:homopolymeric O-antigen transport system ATP-binding protein
MAVAIAAEGLSKRYRIGELQAAYGTLRDTLAHAAARLSGRERHERHEIWAVRDVSFQVEAGEVVGLIGRNGAGKSTLLRLLTRITTPTAGRAEIRGRVGSLLEVGTGFHPELTGRENVYLNGTILGMRRQEIELKFDQIVEFAGVEEFIDTPVKRYSSGMSVRLAFAVAAHLEPEILLVDEVLAVGDAEFRKRCLGRMEELGQTGRTIVFVSHNMQAITDLCDRTILLHKGQIQLDGPSADVVERYLEEHAGTSSHREWHDLAEAPGNDLVRLRSVRAVLEDGTLADVVDVRRPVEIEIAFTVLRRGDVPVTPKIKIVDGQGQIVFNAIDTHPRWHEPPAPGDYTATARIPGNLLNEGLMVVEIGVVELGTVRFYHHIGLRDALSFHVHDPGEGDTARGIYLGQWRGAVRPLLEWTSEER